MALGGWVGGQGLVGGVHGTRYRPFPTNSTALAPPQLLWVAACSSCELRPFPVPPADQMHLPPSTIAWHWGQSCKGAELTQARHLQAGFGGLLAMWQESS